MKACCIAQWAFFELEGMIELAILLEHNPDMPKSFLPILTLLLPLFSLAQSKIDSLKEVSIGLNDTLRFENYLLTASEYYRQADYDEGIAFINSCAKEIRGIRFQRDSPQYNRAMHFLGELFYLESIMYYSMSRYADALAPLDSSTVAFTQGNNFLGLSKTNNLTGALFYFQSEYDSALVYYEKAGEMAAVGSDSSMMTRTVNNRAGIYKQKQEFDHAYEMYEEVRRLGVAMKNKEAIGDAHKGMGDIRYYQSRYSEALEDYAIAIRLLEEINDVTSLSNVLGNMANVYKNQGEYQAALQYSFRALELSKNRKNQKSIAADYLNIGSTYSQMRKQDSAMYYYRMALDINREIDFKPGVAMGYANVGSKLVELDSIYKGIQFLSESVKMYRELKDNYHLVRVLSSLAKAQLENGNISSAERNSYEGYTKSNELNNLDGMMHSAEVYADVMKTRGAYAKALEYREMSFQIKDSLRNEELRDQAIRTDLKLEYNRKVFEDSIQNATARFQQELEFQDSINTVKQRRNLFIFLSLGAVLLALGFYSRTRYVTKSRKRLQKEKDRSDELLLNILPYEVAEELKIKGESKAKSFEDVTVLFTDFKDFTKTAEQLSPEELVDEINICFKAFDQIIQDHQVEKIKTIGDAYMAAGGLHRPRVSETVDVVSAALEMQRFMNQRKNDRSSKNLLSFEMRVGIHTGPVVAGIVGVKKFQYDIWGDTVNTASRMESHGEVSKVNVSDMTYQILKDNEKFSFENRGMIEVKGKGKMGMWYVDFT